MWMSERDCDVAVDVFMLNFIAEIFYGKSSFTVTDNHVQQYGEVNQLGGVFVNVSFTHFNISYKLIHFTLSPPNRVVRCQMEHEWE